MPRQSHPFPTASQLLHRFPIHPTVTFPQMTAQAKLPMNTRALICGLMGWLIAVPAWSSYAIYIGKTSPQMAAS